MILVTVGMQLGFDRLVKAMDDIAPSLDEPVCAQIGKGEFEPQNMDWKRNFGAAELEAHAARSRVIVAHAGVGTVLTARRVGKPIILFPRSMALREHRNDHQIATAKQLIDLPGIYVAEDQPQLSELLHRPTDELAPPDTEARPSSKLLDKIENFILAA